VTSARILVVDDEVDINTILSVTLRRAGYEVISAADGVEAIEIIHLHAPDLILLDVMMPHVDGWEMLRQIQERHGAGSIPIVMFSGKVDAQTAAQAAARGAQGFVGKPFDPQQLVDQAKQIVPV